MSSSVLNQSSLVGQQVVTSEPDDDQSPGWTSAREVPAWAISLGVHLVILGLLSCIPVIAGIMEPELLITSEYEPFDADEFKFDVTVVDQFGNDSEVNKLSPSQASATKVGPDPQKEMQEQLEDEILTVDQPPTTDIVEPNEAEFADSIDISGTTEDPGGVEGSMDRLTFEIAASLKERKTLVVWLFDESGSLTERRNAIADRFENVYKQLGMLKVDTDRALKTAVVGFGLKTKFYTAEPVDDASKVVGLVRSIKEDQSGKEHVFTAVGQIVKKWKIFRTKMRRNIMIIVVTDERGDDVNRLEEVIAAAARYGIRVFCVGNAAAFGREKGYVKWTYSDGFTEDLPVDQGPETYYPQRLQLPFWGVAGFGRKQMSANYGPYALTRLCAETKGMYLIADQGRGRAFDSAVMRNYRPDFRPVRDIEKDVKSNLAKRSLVEAALATSRKPLPRLSLSFRAENDNVLRNEITKAQEPAAKFDYGLKQMHGVLTMGEKARAKIKTPRWRAAYDLAMGRVLAMRVRVYGYNIVLAQMKSSPKSFSKQGNNKWSLVAARDITSGPAVRKMAKKATEYLSRVVDDHPGTPWALLAERELSAPLGWEWKEGQLASTTAGSRNNAKKKQGVLFAEEEKKKAAARKKAMKKRKRPAL